MKVFSAIVVTLAALFVPPLAIADHVWINEFHYDNAGADANEFVEIAFRSGTTTAIGDYSLNLYNGAGGATYAVIDLATATVGATLPIVGDPMGRTVTFYSVAFAGIQNGAPDGLVLSLDSDNSQVGTFLSYEGTFTGTAGPANGVLSTDIGVSENGSGTTAGSLSLVGSGFAAADFTWAVTDPTATSGSVNTGQLLFNAIPEPATLGFAGIGLLALVMRRRREV